VNCMTEEALMMSRYIRETVFSPVNKFRHNELTRFSKVMHAADIIPTRLFVATIITTVLCYP